IIATLQPGNGVLQAGNVSAWLGIRASSVPGNYLISGAGVSGVGGFAAAPGILYDGTIDGSGSGNVAYAVNDPHVTNSQGATTIYGPDNQGSGNIGLVGTWRNGALNASQTVHGFLYEGTEAALANPPASDFTTIDHPNAQFTFPHSLMQGLVVGSYNV